MGIPARTVFGCQQDNGGDSGDAAIAQFARRVADPEPPQFFVEERGYAYIFLAQKLRFPVSRPSSEPPGFFEWKALPHFGMGLL